MLVWTLIRSWACGPVQGGRDQHQRDRGKSQDLLASQHAAYDRQREGREQPHKEGQPSHRDVVNAASFGDSKQLRIAQTEHSAEAGNRDDNRQHAADPVQAELPFDVGRFEIFAGAIIAR